MKGTGAGRPYPRRTRSHRSGRGIRRADERRAPDRGGATVVGEDDEIRRSVGSGSVVLLGERSRVATSVTALYPTGARPCRLVGNSQSWERGRGLGQGTVGR